MRVKKQILLAVVILLLTSLACSLPFNPGSPSPEEISETAAAAIAATLTAMAPVEAPTAISEPETPGGTPLPDTETTTIIKSKPDELRLAVVDSNRNLFTWMEGGTFNLMVNTGDVFDPVISPDGEWIVYVRRSADLVDVSLWAMRFNGSDQQELVSHSEFMAMPLDPDVSDIGDIRTVSPYMVEFIPGTHTVAFSTYPQFDFPGLVDNKDLWYINLDTGERRSLLSPGQAGHFYFSPDGTQMALVTPDRIDLLNTDGSNRRIGILSYAFVYTYSEYAYHALPVWSEDSSYLRVSIPPQDPLGDPTAPVNIYHLPTDGSMATLLTSVVVAPLENVILAPDLNHFAYKEQIGDPVENLFSLKLSDLSGGSPVEFTTGSLGIGDWAPDSSHFYFFTWNPREYFIGQSGVPGVIAVDANPANNFSWINSERYLFIYQSGTSYQLRIGSLSTPSVEIGNLGSGLGNPTYDFITP